MRVILYFEPLFFEQTWSFSANSKSGLSWVLNVWETVFFKSGFVNSQFVRLQVLTQRNTLRISAQVFNGPISHAILCVAYVIWLWRPLRLRNTSPENVGPSPPAGQSSAAVLAERTGVAVLSSYRPPPSQRRADTDNLSPLCTAM